MKAHLYWFSLESYTCQYTEIKSMDKKYLAPPKLSKATSIFNKGYKSFLVIRLSFKYLSTPCCFHFFSLIKKGYTMEILT